MTNNPCRILVGDCSEPMQRWIAMAAVRASAGRRAEVVAAGSGPELLHHLANGERFDLVVTQATMPFMGGAAVLAMTRTAGLDTPFVVLDYVPTSKLRKLIARAGHAKLVDDPLDAGAIANAARAFLHTDDASRLHPRDELHRAATGVCNSSLRRPRTPRLGARRQAAPARPRGG